jgi:YD repeat-containing protein
MLRLEKFRLVNTVLSRGLMKALGTVALGLTLFSAESHAIVDMKNANYSETWIDVTLTGTGYPLRVNRAYNSRSIFNGMFGFGWCSDFETVIEKLPEGRLKLTECGAGQEILYTPAKYDHATVAKLNEQLIAHYKKKNPQVTAEALETFKAQLASSEFMRTEWAKDAGVPAPEAQKGTVYASDSLAVEQIVFDGTAYTRTLSDGTLQKFDNNGRVTAFYDKNGNFLKFTYRGNLLNDVTDNNGRKLSFNYYPNRRIKEIIAPGNIRSEYKYKGEDLIEVKNMWKNTYTYQYSETHNLVRINFPDRTFKALTYSEKKDWVTSFTDRATSTASCVENYVYDMDKENPRDHFWSIVTKRCGTEIVNESRFEFWHKPNPKGPGKYLARTLTKSPNDSLDVTYHPEFGRPLVIRRNGSTTTFEYFPNGLIKEKTTSTARMVFEYKNQYNKVSKVTTDFFDDRGKAVKRRQTDFAYDNKSNLIAAQNSDGQSVRLTYDDRGRIATIADQAKKEVMIKYDEKSGKPAQITRPKVGTIHVTYKANGEINKVDSSDGPTVAVQIASTFNNLLDIISPATSELSL